MYNRNMLGETLREHVCVLDNIITDLIKHSLYLSFGNDRFILDHCFSNQDCVECSATKKLISRDEEFQPVITKNKRLAQTTNLHIFLACGSKRHGIFVVGCIVNKLHSRSFFKSLSGSINIYWELCLYDDRLRMSTVSRDPNSCATKREVVRKAAYFPCLPCHFHFFLGVTIFLKLVNVWDHVKRKRMSKDLVFRHFSLSAEDSSRPLLEFVHSRLPCTRCCLVCRHDHPLDLE
mmetsp:Transcript_32387/g.43185  ORF Transcript_32387/g.43185 Transcript_32387/m.43185 type:complete len:234 (-) Transcript_32387:888-1589(-)